jgi:putative transcriptional regulator
MTRHVDELLPDYVLGALADDDAAAVKDHLASCARCAQELRAVEAAFEALALALPAPPPPQALRARVLAATEAGRFEAFVNRVAAVIDCAVDQARALLAKIDEASSWVDGPLGTQLVHLPAGPRVAHANCGFVRLPAGAQFPSHRHLGAEHTLVLEGRYLDSSGRTLGPGDEARLGPGSEHSFAVLPDADLVYLVVLETGIEVAGAPGVSL